MPDNRIQCCFPRNVFYWTFILLNLGYVVVGSSKWDGLDSKFSQNYHRSRVEWKQGSCCWQEVGWGPKPQRERKDLNSCHFCISGKLQTFLSLFFFLQFSDWQIISCNLVFDCLQYFFIIKPLIRAIKSDAAKEAKPVWARASRKLWICNWMHPFSMFLTCFWFQVINCNILQ